MSIQTVNRLWKVGLLESPEGGGDRKTMLGWRDLTKEHQEALLREAGTRGIAKILPAASRREKRL